jgi:peptide/nickel transport system permease protein
MVRCREERTPLGSSAFELATALLAPASSVALFSCPDAIAPRLSRNRDPRVVTTEAGTALNARIGLDKPLVEQRLLLTIATMLCAVALALVSTRWPAGEVDRLVAFRSVGFISSSREQNRGKWLAPVCAW